MKNVLHTVRNRVHRLASCKRSHYTIMLVIAAMCVHDGDIYKTDWLWLILALFCEDNSKGGGE